jgi:hypothetical protein
VDSRRKMTRKTRLMIVGAFGALTLIAFCLTVVLPRFLVLDNRAHSNYIAVLDGHDENYLEGLRLLREGYAERMFLCLDMPDVPIEGEELKKDREFIDRTAGPLSEKIETCPNRDEDIYGLMSDLFARSGVSKVLIVTPAPYSRAQYISFRRHLPQYNWSVYPTHDPSFGAHWWGTRLWAKTFVTSVLNLGTALTEPSPSAQRVERSAKAMN